MKEKHLVIYHANCNDGMTSAALVCKHLYLRNWIGDLNYFSVHTMALHFSSQDKRIRVPVHPSHAEVWKEWYNENLKSNSSIKDLDVVDIIPLIKSHGFTHCWIVDYTPPSTQLIDLLSMFGNNLVLLDHHDTYNKYTVYTPWEYAQLDDQSKRILDTLVFSTKEDPNDINDTSGGKRSGSGLVLDTLIEPIAKRLDDEQFKRFCMGNTAQVAECVNDRDLWVRRTEALEFHEGVYPIANSREENEWYGNPKPFKLPLPHPSVPVSQRMAILHQLDSGVEVLGLVLNDAELFEALKVKGRAAIEYRDGLIKSICGSARFYKANKFCDVNHIIVDCPYALASECGEYLRNAYPEYHAFFMIRITRDFDSISVSLRSRSGYFNAREFALDNGGGGHPAAAGCSIKMDRWNSFSEERERTIV